MPLASPNFTYTGHVPISRLDDDGNHDSLREVLARSTPGWLITFSVGGEINLQSTLNIPPGVHIACETAPPGIGITFTGDRVRIASDDVTISHPRFAIGNQEGSGKLMDALDCLQIDGAKRVKIDHATMAFGTDECASVIGASVEDIQILDSLIYFGLARAGHSKSTPPPGSTLGYTHSKGLLVRRDHARVEIARNLFAFHDDRFPVVQGGTEAAVVSNLCVGGVNSPMVSLVGDPGKPNNIDVVNNDLRPGPAHIAMTDPSDPEIRKRQAAIGVSDMDAASQVHISGNRAKTGMDRREDVHFAAASDEAVISPTSAVSWNYDRMPVEAVAAHVLANAGPCHKHPLDELVKGFVRDGVDAGLIDHEEELNRLLPPRSERVTKGRWVWPTPFPSDPTAIDPLDLRGRQKWETWLEQHGEAR